MIEDLHVIDGYVKNERFILVSVLGHSVHGQYKADGLRDWARVIGNESFTMVIDDEKELYISEEKAIIMQNELNKVANYLDKNKKPSDMNNIELLENYSHYTKMGYRTPEEQEHTGDLRQEILKRMESYERP